VTAEGSSDRERDERHPHVFVADLERPELDDDDRHHLARVLRVRDGDPITASDGRGRWRPCTFGVTLEPTGVIVLVEPPAVRLTIGFALVKGERPELVVQKLTELGMDRIVPFVGARSVVRWDPDRAEKQLQRLRRVAREAAMQSRRCHLPEVGELSDFATLVQQPGMAIADKEGAPPGIGLAGALIGPEGGWTDEERAQAAAIGAPAIALGGHVLRAETAAFTAAALLAALRLGLVRPAGGGVA
jgi:16S rRNA (uracil1498-N3)-methyltransferase